MVRPRSRIKLFLTLIAVGGVAFLGRSLWLPWFGHALVRDEGPGKAEIAVVLAGDQSGHRIAKGAEMVRQGYVPAVLVSGPALYGIHECDLAIALAVRQGYPAGWFIPFPNSTLSTQQEARAILEELRRRSIHSFLLVTSDYHTARAARIYRAAERAMGGGPDMRVVAAADPYFHERSWWSTRESLKTVFFEWSKTLGSAVGL